MKTYATNNKPILSKYMRQYPTETLFSRQIILYW